MSNQYERSAIAESDEGIGTLVADNAAEQQDSLSPLQLLYSVVEHNVANPDKRIKLSPEQGKEIMKDFAYFVAGSSDTPTNEDGQPKTFSDMDDNELLKCLSDYLGSGVANTSINGAGIELAQDLVLEMYMSEDELEGVANPKTENGRSAKEKKALERMRDAAEEEAAQLKESRDKWEKEVWSNQTYDVGSLKLTGKQIDSILDTLSNSQKRAKLADDYKNKFGGTTAEADQVLTDTEKYLKAKKRYEFLKATNQLDKMTAQDKVDLDLIKTNPKIEQTVQFIDERNLKATKDRGLNISVDGYQKSTVEQQISSIELEDDVRHKLVRIGTSAVSEYEDKNAVTIKTAVNPQEEFNSLGNPATAVTATANMNVAKNTTPLNLADKKVVSLAADMS